MKKALFVVVYHDKLKKIKRKLILKCYFRKTLDWYKNKNKQIK